MDYDYEQFQEQYKNLTVAQIKASMIIECKTLSDNGHMTSIEIPQYVCRLLMESSEDTLKRID
jgi:hypothetical protein